ncbi:MAG: hypothetical protein KME17_01025 [Cyanosarcina radialis HA8281-LM2]|jgi:hypothetical protein|nr:hypothetical protein [Cyanosarcina radialis HA8281-LM2]
MSIQLQQTAFLSEIELSDRELEIITGGTSGTVPTTEKPKPCLILVPDGRNPDGTPKYKLVNICDKK